MDNVEVARLLEAIKEQLPLDMLIEEGRKAEEQIEVEKQIVKEETELGDILRETEFSELPEVQSFNALTTDLELLGVEITKAQRRVSELEGEIANYELVYSNCDKDVEDYLKFIESTLDPNKKAAYQAQIDTIEQRKANNERWLKEAQEELATAQEYVEENKRTLEERTEELERARQTAINAIVAYKDAQIDKNSSNIRYLTVKSGILASNILYDIDYLIEECRKDPLTITPAEVNWTMMRIRDVLGAEKLVLDYTDLSDETVLELSEERQSKIDALTRKLSGTYELTEEELAEVQTKEKEYKEELRKVRRSIRDKDMRLQYNNEAILEAQTDPNLSEEEANKRVAAIQRRNDRIMANRREKEARLEYLNNELEGLKPENYVASREAKDRAELESLMLDAEKTAYYKRLHSTPIISKINQVLIATGSKPEDLVINPPKKEEETVKRGAVPLEDLSDVTFDDEDLKPIEKPVKKDEKKEETPVVAAPIDLSGESLDDEEKGPEDLSGESLDDGDKEPEDLSGESLDDEEKDDDETLFVPIVDNDEDLDEVIGSHKPKGILSSKVKDILKKAGVVLATLAAVGALIFALNSKTPTPTTEPEITPAPIATQTPEIDPEEDKTPEPGKPTPAPTNPGTPTPTDPGTPTPTDPGTPTPTDPGTPTPTDPPVTPPTPTDPPVTPPTPTDPPVTPPTPTDPPVTPPVIPPTPGPGEVLLPTNLTNDDGTKIPTAIVGPGGQQINDSGHTNTGEDLDLPTNGNYTVVDLDEFNNLGPVQQPVTPPSDNGATGVGDATDPSSLDDLPEEIRNQFIEDMGRGNLDGPSAPTTPAGPQIVADAQLAVSTDTNAIANSNEVPDVDLNELASGALGALELGETGPALVP